ncbi:MAG: M16 family metallopeptidase [Gammaproteobacteria bacterium]
MIEFSKIRQKQGLIKLGMLFFMASTPIAWADAVNPAEQLVLDNGLKIIAIEDSRLPVAEVQIWYRVGSADEHGGQTGLSHFLEHLMFKGTPKAPGNTFMSFIDKIGGQVNAATSYDFTFYHQFLPVNQLKAVLDFEADRLANLEFNQEKFQKELEVVKEERRLRTDDLPEGRLVERFRNLALSNSPYAAPVIGWMQDLNEMKMDYTKNWYQTWYAPNNATVLIVGKINPKEALNLAKESFGGLVKKNLPPRKPMLQDFNFGARRLVVEDQHPVPLMLWGFNLPHFSNSPALKEAFALEVLGVVLAGKSSSRINKKLYHEENKILDAQVQVGNLSRYPDLFTLKLQIHPEQDLAGIEKAVWKEIEAIQKNGISKEELDMAKLQALADRVFVQDDIMHRAIEYGYLETIGAGWQWVDRYVDAIDSLSKEDIQSVAQKYLQIDRSTIAVLQPKKSLGI